EQREQWRTAFRRPEFPQDFNGRGTHLRFRRGCLARQQGNRRELGIPAGTAQQVGEDGAVLECLSECEQRGRGNLVEPPYEESKGGLPVGDAVAPVPNDR